MGQYGSTTYSEDNDGYDIYSFIFPETTPIGQNISDIGITNYNNLITTDNDVLTTRPKDSIPLTIEQKAARDKLYAEVQARTLAEVLEQIRKIAAAGS